MFELLLVTINLAFVNLQVNGVDLSQASHLQARQALKQLYPICRLAVYREKSDDSNLFEKEGKTAKRFVDNDKRQRTIKLKQRFNISSHLSSRNVKKISKHAVSRKINFNEDIILNLKNILFSRINQSFLAKASRKTAGN